MTELARKGPNLFRVALTRLRFLLVFAVIFALIASWETIRVYRAKLMTIAIPEGTTSSDTEYFCPMDPGILSDWPSKCPVCNMTLVRRKRGEATPLPDGVMARMQFTPYRLWLGGIRTETVDYAALEKVLELPGIALDPSSPQIQEIEAKIFPSELAWIEPGQTVDIIPIDNHQSQTIISGKVRDLPPSEATGKLIVVTTTRLKPKAQVRLRVHSPADRFPPFRDQATAPPPLVRAEVRRLHVCMEHPDIVMTSPGRCPRDGSELMPRQLSDNQRVRWWCPMHPQVVSERPGATCSDCGGMVLTPRAISYRPPGKVLTVPESAVIDDGSRSYVYLQRGGGMFDAKTVVIGSRCDGGMFPVITGLEPGDRVAAHGAFLIDAETRLNPSLAAGYFGAGQKASQIQSITPTHVPASTPSEKDWIKKLAESDRPKALEQKHCPVTGFELGSMGVPTKLNVKGRTLFVCCPGCTETVEANPVKYLSQLPAERTEKRP